MIACTVPRQGRVVCKLNTLYLKTVFRLYENLILYTILHCRIKRNSTLLMHNTIRQILKILELNKNRITGFNSLMINTQNYNYKRIILH